MHPLSRFYYHFCLFLHSNNINGSSATILFSYDSAANRLAEHSEVRNIERRRSELFDLDRLKIQSKIFACLHTTAYYILHQKQLLEMAAIESPLKVVADSTLNAANDSPSTTLNEKNNSPVASVNEREGAYDAMKKGEVPLASTQAPSLMARQQELDPIQANPFLLIYQRQTAPRPLPRSLKMVKIKIQDKMMMCLVHPILQKVSESETFLALE